VALGGSVATVGFPGSGFYEEAGKPRKRIHSWFLGFLIKPKDDGADTGFLLGS
jgi:hypothetical protein